MQAIRYGGIVRAEQFLSLAQQTWPGAYSRPTNDTAIALRALETSLIGTHGRRDVIGVDAAGFLWAE